MAKHPQKWPNTQWEKNPRFSEETQHPPRSPGPFTSASNEAPFTATGMGWARGRLYQPNSVGEEKGSERWSDLLKATQLVSCQKDNSKAVLSGSIGVLLIYALAAQMVVPAAAASLGGSIGMKDPRLHPDLQNQNLHFNKILRWFVCSWKFEKHHQSLLSQSLPYIWITGGGGGETLKPKIPRPTQNNYIRFSGGGGGGYW